MLDSKDPSKIKGKKLQMAGTGDQEHRLESHGYFQTYLLEHDFKVKKGWTKFHLFWFHHERFFFAHWIWIFCDKPRPFSDSVLNQSENFSFFCSPAAIIFAIERTLMYGLISFSCA